MAEHLSEGAQKALKLFYEGRDYHDHLVDKVDDLYKSFEGKLDNRAEAADWTPRLHPPYINHIVETTMAGLVDDRVKFHCSPLPRFYNPGEYEIAIQGAKAHEILLDCQMRQAKFQEIMRPWGLQAAIAGYSVVKTYWKRDVRVKPRLELEADGQGLPSLRESEKAVPMYDGPMTEVRDVRDFFWHQAAPSIDRAAWVADRVWMTLEECKSFAKSGVFKNVEKLQDPKFVDEDTQRELDKENRSRTKDMIEVLEIWYRTKDGIRVVTLGNRCVELVADRKNPFWHGEYPFTVLSFQPGLFGIGGMGLVEKIKHLQDAHWDLTGQTHMNVQLANNNIVMIRDDVDDPDSFEFEPGARWLVSDPSAVTHWSPDPQIAAIAIPHLERLEEQMQNLAGSQPFTSTSEGQLNAQTATEAALVTNLASRSVQAQKQQWYLALERVVRQWVELNQQFIRTPMMVEKIGLDSQEEMVSIAPYLLQGDYLVSTRPMTESLIRQERRAEAQAKLQMALNAVPVVAVLAQQQSATMLNIDRFVKDWLESYDVFDASGYFTAQKPAPPQGQGQPQGQQALPAGAEQGGVTSPLATDAATSPSNETSLAATQLMQRALASTGGAVNGPALNGASGSPIPTP